MVLHKHYMIWLPRVIAAIFITLLTILSLDAFDGSGNAVEQFLAFLIHLIPAFLTTACLVVAWKYRVFGGLLFLFLGIVFTFYFETARGLTQFLLISAPLFAAGILFLLSAQNANE